MRILYPSDPLDNKKPDEDYAAEFAAAKSLGISCSVYSAEEFEAGDFRARPALNAGEEILYRGWMLNPQQYASLEAAIESISAKMITSSKQYQRCHHLPEWYEQCRDVTPKTIVLTKEADFEAAVSQLGWEKYFVKDFVKSLTTSRGSIAATPQEIGEIVHLIGKFRGAIEGGVCIREFENLLHETEERYFVFRGKPYSYNNVVPDIVTYISSRIDSPFYSVDIVLNSERAHRLIELGDGQVSDRKKWPADKFVEMFHG